MNYLYHTKFKNTFKEYKKMYLVLARKRMFFVVAIMIALFILLGALSKNRFFYIFALAIPFFEYFTATAPLKKVYYSNKLAVDAELNYEFYEDFLIKKSAAGEEKVEYKKLLKIIETKTNFYLMIAVNQGYILKKSDIPEGLAEFIREKALLKQ